MGVTVAIPTFGRERVLIETIEAVLREGADELIVVDQTPEHEAETAAQLEAWAKGEAIRWIRLEVANIPAAMNRALVEARGELVLFLDDDIEPHAGFVDAHRRAHAGSDGVLAVVGQILQPGEEAIAPPEQGPFCFRSTEPGWPRTAMGGNLSVKRLEVIRLGGFDENFVGAAFQFEREFAERVWESGGKVRYDPGPSIRHLRAPRGGTRAHGLHLTTVSPAHAVGAYYFLIQRRRGLARVRGWGERLVRSVATRHHLRRPWGVPVTLIAEVRGMVLALRLARSGPKFVEVSVD